MARWKWAPVAAGVLVTALLATVACGGGGAPQSETTASGSEASGGGAGSGTPRDTLVMAVNSPTDNFDPAVGSSVPYWRLLLAAYEPLVRIDPETMKPEPWLATDWSHNSGDTEWTFHLRDGVKFHDGTTLTAADVKASVERELKIGKGESYLISDVDTVEAVDDRTVKFTLKTPDPQFVLDLSRVWIISSRGLGEHEKDGDMAQAWLANHEDGTGPYRLTEWVDGQRYTFARFDDYWRGWQGQHVSRLEFRVVTDDATQALLLQQGQVDYAENIPDENVQGLAGDPGIQVIKSETLSPYYIAMNTQKGPLSNPKVRQAIALAFDYDAAIQQGMNGLASPLRGPLPSKFPDFNDQIPAPHQDLETAKKLLAEAGYPGGGFSLTYMYLEHWLFEKTIGLVLQQNLKQLGIDVQLQAQPWATMVARMKDRDKAPDLVMYAQSVPTPDPLSILYPMYESKSDHWSHFMYADPKVDELLNQARNELDLSKRGDLIRQVQAQVVADQPQVFLFTKVSVAVFRSDVKGYRYNPFFDKMLNYYDIHKID